MSTVPKAISGWIKHSRLADLLSFRYAMLRGSTAGSALVAGLIQTFVFARILSPERFSVFILVGAVGVSMWLFDLGLSKILFARLRKRYLAGENTLTITSPSQCDRKFLRALDHRRRRDLLCRHGFPAGCLGSRDAAEFALFFFFSAFNLAWFVLRNVSVTIR